MLSSPELLVQAPADALAGGMAPTAGALQLHVTIPNVCHHFGIERVNTFDMLDKLDARFALSKKAAA